MEETGYRRTYSVFLFLFFKFLKKNYSMKWGNSLLAGDCLLSPMIIKPVQISEEMFMNNHAWSPWVWEG